MNKRKTPPAKENTTLALAWYRPDQWTLLHAVSTDSEQLEEQYAEWLEYAEQEFKKLQSEGFRVVKLDVDVNDIIRWCTEQGRPLDGNARAEYATRKLREQQQG